MALGIDHTEPLLKMQYLLFVVKIITGLNILCFSHMYMYRHICEQTLSNKSKGYMSIGS